MTEQQLIHILNQVGFPVAVAAYLLFRGDKLMREMTRSVKELTQAVTQWQRNSQR